MDVLEAIHGRRAIRDYQDRSVGAEVVRSLAEAAVWAPSGVNRQPWAFFVLDDPAALAACSAEAKAVVLQSEREVPDALRAMLTSPDFSIFYNAPVLVVICATTEDEMARKDCCLAAQNLMLAAHAQGLGSCWIGFAEPWLATAVGKSRLGVPSDFTPVAPLIVGYPKAAPPAPERRAPDIRYVAAKS
jgi:nitroreductase